MQALPPCDFWLQVLRCSGPPSAVATLEVDRRFHIVVPSRVWQAVTLMSLAVASPTVPLCAAENSLAKARASSASELFVNRGVPKRFTANVDTLPMLNAASSQLWASINAAPRTVARLDMFSGAGGISHEGTAAHHWEGYPFDISNYADQDITRVVGMVHAMFALACAVKTDSFTVLRDALRGFAWPCAAQNKAAAQRHRG